MEDLLNEENEINERIKELCSYDEDLDLETKKLSSRVGELWNNYGSLSEEELEEYNTKNKELAELRFNKSQKQRNELYKLYKRLEYLSSQKYKLVPSMIRGDRLELKRLSDNICDDYIILLKYTDIIVGNISYRGYHFSNFLGDIGFTINPEYRGNGYAYEALCLLSDILYDNNINDFWITAFEENYPSINTILKYGSKKLNSEYENVVFYECQTKKNVYNKEVIR